MTIRELIEQLTQLAAELPVYVASTLGDDQCELELVLPHLALKQAYSPRRCVGRVLRSGVGPRRVAVG